MNSRIEPEVWREHSKGLLWEVGRQRLAQNSAPAKARKWIAFGATLALMLVATVAFGGDGAPCYEAYLASGLSQQQLPFEEFQELYGDGVCAPE